jgi:hypothetical protein
MWRRVYCGTACTTQCPSSTFCYGCFQTLDVCGVWKLHHTNLRSNYVEIVNVG